MRFGWLCVLAAMLLGGCGEEGRDGGGDSARASAAGIESEALSADKEWLAALTAGNRDQAAQWIDAEFEWIDVDGRVWDSKAALEGTGDLAADLATDGSPGTYHYGHVEVLTSALPDMRSMRVWVLRPAGWRVFEVISTALERGTTPFAATSGATASDCENPCRSMPFTPRNDDQRAIADLFMQLKMDEWHPNPERWASYVLDGVDYTTATAQLSKQERVAHLTALASTGAASVPGDPVVSMQIFDFADSAIMRAQHVPFRGGAPYISVRVWAHSDGRWQLANTQQTAIANAPPTPPVAN